jgi:hypothetical protein
MFEDFSFSTVPMWVWIVVGAVIVAVLGWLYMSSCNAGAGCKDGVCPAPPSVQFAPEAQVMHYIPEEHPTSITCIVNDAGEQVCSAPDTQQEVNSISVPPSTN